MQPVLQQDFEYVNVRPGSGRHDPAGFYEKWVEQSSAKHTSPEITAADALRRMYPGYSLVVSDDDRLTSLFALPDITIHPSDSDGAELKQVSNVVFKPAPRPITRRITGSLVDKTILGSYRIIWNKSGFVVHIAKFQIENCMKTVYFILHDGPEQPARDLVLAACLYTEQTHGEIWVFNQSAWSKNEGLWHETKDSSWDNVVMKEERKAALQRDVYGFFKAEVTYKKLSIPWKRGLIMYGPPGNGKTISIKVIVKTCAEHGFTPLYVKSFQGRQGEEGAMQSIFLKARQVAPCVLDGIDGIEGLLVIASTNHFDRLDPGLSNRPSRFDRKYLFDDPDYQERVLYVKHWKGRLKDHDEIYFPESLVEEAADLTQGFSFAYLKEAFVSTLVWITNADDDERITFPVVLKSQIMTLSRELGKETPTCIIPHSSILGARPEKAPDEGISPVEPRSTTLQNDKFVQGSRGSMQLSFPADVSDDSHLLPRKARIVCQFSADSPGPRATEKSYTAWKTSPGRPFPQGCVLHAPPSAYPQVIPGSLPSTNPDPLQDPIYPAWHGASVGSNSSTSSADINPRNLFSIDNPPLTKIDDNVHAEESSASTSRDA